MERPIWRSEQPLLDFKRFRVCLESLRDLADRLRRFDLFLSTDRQWLAPLEGKTFGTLKLFSVEDTPMFLGT